MAGSSARYRQTPEIAEAVPGVGVKSSGVSVRSVSIMVSSRPPQPEQMMIAWFPSNSAPQDMQRKRMADPDNVADADVPAKSDMCVLLPKSLRRRIAGSHTCLLYTSDAADALTR